MRANPWLWLAILLILATGVNVVWHATHVTPVNAGKDAAIIASRQVRDFGARPWTELRALLTDIVQPSYSLYNLSAGLTLGTVGRTYRGLVAVSSLYYLAFIALAFGMARRLGDDRAALLAATLAALLPAAFSWSRLFSPNIALMTVSAAGLYCLAASHWATRTVPLLIFAVLAALSIRVGETVGDNFQTWLVFGVALAYVLVVRLAVMREKRLRALAILGAAAAVFALVVDYRYVNYASRYLWTEGVELAEPVYREGAAGDVGSWLVYPTLMWKLHVLPLLTIGVAAAVVWLLARPKWKSGFAVAALLGPLVLFTLVSKKNYNYLYAALPMVPVVIGLAWANIQQRRLASVLAAVLVGGSLVLFGWLSFVDRTVRPPSDDIEGGIRATNVRHTTHLAFYPRRAMQHPPTQIVQAAVDLAKNGGGNLVIVATAGDIEINAFRMLLELANWDGVLTVLDMPDRLRGASMGLVARAPFELPTAEPDVLVVFPSAQCFLDDDFTCHPDRVAVPLRPGQAMPPLFVTQAQAWCAWLNQLPWRQYRARHYRYPVASSMHDQYWLTVYDRPDRDRGLTIVAPALAQPPTGITPLWTPPAATDVHPASPVPEPGP